MTTETAPTGSSASSPRNPATASPRAPDTATFALVSLALVIVGGIYLASSMPGRVNLAPGIGLAAASAAGFLAGLVVLPRGRAFAWGTFRRVAGWVLCAYLVIAGMLEFVFVYDHTPGRVLSVLSVLLALFAGNVVLLLAYSVARYQPPD
jgi:hypothetical protein